MNAPEIISPNLVNVAPVQFLTNTTGDQAIVFEQRVGSDTDITVVRHSAGGLWAPQDTVASTAKYGNLSLSSAALAGNGDILETFEMFTVACSRYCHDINYVVNASREASGSTSWQDSGALTPASSTYTTRTAMNDYSRGCVIWQNSVLGPVEATTQSAEGAKWHSAVQAFGGSPYNGAQLWQLASGENGNVNLALVGFSNAGASVNVLDGNLPHDEWDPPNTLSTGDNPGANDNMVLAVSSRSAGVTTWSDVDGTVRASLRGGATATWTDAQEIIGFPTATSAD